MVSSPVVLISRVIRVFLEILDRRDREVLGNQGLR